MTEKKNREWLRIFLNDAQAPHYQELDATPCKKTPPPRVNDEHDQSLRKCTRWKDARGNKQQNQTRQTRNDTENPAAAIRSACTNTQNKIWNASSDTIW